MSYRGVYIQCQPFMAEILLAELGQLPYNTFEETLEGLHAFCDESDFDPIALQEIIDRYVALDNIRFETKELAKENWNEDWEKNYDPVIVDDQVIIKAIFHQIEKRYPFEITIHPKMSFGTGHHATTYLMIRQQLKIDHRKKIVYDFGTGTGVLAIMAAKLGASKLVATDVDDWCIENSKENLTLNDLKAQLLLGPVATLGLSEKADIVLANINKNILLAEMENYISLLNTGGYLLLSGFYQKDCADLIHLANSFQLFLREQDDRNQWAVLVFQKQAL
jgi:ribosomal protein L11 methyltransferase